MFAADLDAEADKLERRQQPDDPSPDGDDHPIAVGSSADAVGSLKGSSVTHRDKDGIVTAAHWRERAEEARTLASEMSDRGGKGTLEKIALLYDMMAERAENREEPIKTSK